jgi:hypothetical protein
VTSEPDYRNDSVVRRIAADHGLSEDAARACFQEMLRFLDVVAESERSLSPSVPVDDAWHAFIVHTRAYADYCEARFGSFIHHEPGSGAGSDVVPNAESLITARFGAVDARFWPPRASDCGGNNNVSDCGGEKQRLRGGPGVEDGAVAVADCAATRAARSGSDLAFSPSQALTATPEERRREGSSAVPDRSARSPRSLAIA